jgi:hypothetical protein
MCIESFTITYQAKADAQLDDLSENTTVMLENEYKPIE